MEKMVKSIVMRSVLMLGLVLSLNSLYAQGKPASSEEMATREVARIKTDLSLSTDQEQSVKSILLKYEEQKKAVREESKNDREAGRKKMEELEKKKEEEIKAVLTSEQYQKLQAKKSEMSNRGKGKK